VKTKLATVALFLAALLAAMALGGSFYEALVVYPAWSAAPPASLALLQGPHAVDSAGFWILVHVAFEIALVAALALNWRAPRRRTLLLAGLGVHIVMRAWTFLYFVPEITHFMAAAPGGPYSPELAARVSLWGTLGWARRALIAATSLLVLLALITPAGAGEPAGSEGRDRQRERATIGLTQFLTCSGAHRTG
jgi:hypothetical protein